MSIQKTFVIDINLTSKELAKYFCEMSDHEQAKFFNELGIHAKKWINPFVYQLEAICNSPHLTSNGRNIMWEIGEYAYRNYGPKI